MKSTPHRPPGPAPDNAPLELMVECRTSKTSVGGHPHLVTIHSDWTVSTPHDFEAERVAAAFGSYTSCVTLVDRTIPAFKESFDLLTRSAPVHIRADKRGGWRVSPGHSLGSCCRGHKFGDVVSAARHLRSTSHLSAQHEVPRWQLESVMHAAEAMWGSWEGSPKVDRRIERLVRESGGIGELWRAGVHPDRIQELAGAATSVTEPLSTHFYLGMIYGNVDRSWLSSVLAHRPDPDTATWLAWLDQPHKRGTATDWGVWLGFGVPKNDVLAAIDAKIKPAYVHEIAALTSRDPEVVARHLAMWARAGCIPTPAHFKALQHHRVLDPRPRSKAIDALCHDAELIFGMDVEPYRYTADRTDLAVMLEILGTRHDVVIALKRDVRSPADLERYVRMREEGIA